MMDLTFQTFEKADINGCYIFIGCTKGSEIDLVGYSGVNLALINRLSLSECSSAVKLSEFKNLVCY